MTARKPLETDLYGPVKALLEAQGYTVKGEIGPADVVACRGTDDPVIVELKTGFSLALVHQAIARLSISPNVYIAVPRGTGRSFRTALNLNTKLCRRLGVGLITVRLRDGFVDVHVDPAPYKPRTSRTGRARLLREFAQRVGDPNTGGSTRRTLVTAYRQDALRCLDFLGKSGPLKASYVAAGTTVLRARQIMSDNHYGWFERVDRGVYGLSPRGKAALKEFGADINLLHNKDNTELDRT
ncbi:MAG: DUF2161 family putative PD-(D/E)XK-type phosphodiesterase [Pseudomonadota bacterium]